LAHRTAIDTGLQTIAFPGSGLNNDVLYPHNNRKLAQEIIYSGGALISEFEPNQKSALWTFPKRNRLMAGISHAVIVIEAELISGTLITSKLATDYNRDVGAVPGQIYSSLSDGPNMLISKGAKIIRSSKDILELLDMEIPNSNPIQNPLFNNLSSNEISIMKLLRIEPYNVDDLINKSKLNARELNTIISNLEINNLIEEINGQYKLK
jgi:DNA processing protein